MSDLTEETVSQLVDVGKALGGPQEVKDGNTPFVVIPDGYKIQNLSEYVYNDRTNTPQRKKGTAKVLDGPSFTEYFTLFRDPNSRVFADETKNCIVGVLDYHEAGSGSPRWGQHRVELTLRRSEEWARWTGKNGVKQTQMDFAEFIEQNAPDIVTPSAATMLEMARDLSAKTDVDFGSAIRVQNGNVKFKYSEQTKASFGAGEMEVPEQFVIAIPIYIGTPRMQITARLRYRIASGKLTFHYDLLRSDAAEREAFHAIYQTIADALQVVIINGVPA